MPKTKTSFEPGHPRPPGAGSKKETPTGRIVLATVANEAFDHVPDYSVRKPTRMEHAFRVYLSNPEQYPKEVVALAKYLYPEFSDPTFAANVTTKGGVSITYKVVNAGLGTADPTETG